MTTQSELFTSAKTPAPTPMMQQYLSIKAEHQDCLLFYRLGDFYELFFEDAIKAAPILDVVLTKRGKALEDQIPMCGVPYHSSDPYFSKLLKAGFKVAICEQLESPLEAKKRGAKSVVRREVVRIITPGTVTAENMLSGKQEQNLVAIHVAGNELNLACADITTGKLLIQKTSKSDLSNELARLKPHEILIADKTFSDSCLKKALDSYKPILSLRADNLFGSIRATEKIKQFYNIISLEALGTLDSDELVAIGALLEYISYTHKSVRPRLEKPRRLNSSNYLEIDAATRRNLEILESISGDSKKSILHIIDKTITSMGGRLFTHHLSFPLTNSAAINKRIDNVEFFTLSIDLMDTTRIQLAQIPDFERLLAKVFLERAHFQDLMALRDGLAATLHLADNLRTSTGLSDGLKIALSQIGNFSDLLENLNSALVNNALSVQNQRYIALGYSPKLDALYSLKDNANTSVEALRDKYRQMTGVHNLKISFNNMLGYFIDVTAGQLGKITDSMFILRQSMVNGSRFTTAELQFLERQISECDQNIASEEDEIFAKLCNKVIQLSDAIASAAHALAVIDVASAAAFLAHKNKYVRPTIDDSHKFIIDGGRHPLVEHYAKGSFIANSCVMGDGDNLWLITGPNMAGKSTYLRQNAVIIIMAQMGGFVPAKSAHIGVVDKLFSRIGAADDISSGHSTFMVEMIETAGILNNATSRSFLIMDEVGRGTSTKDGLAIAWSILENIHNNIKARTLFATHYHELTDLENILPNLTCYTMRVKEWDGKVVFIHEVIKGKADKSYGIHVAQIAGIPDSVISRATELLGEMSNSQTSNLNVNVVNDNNEWLAKEILGADLDSMTTKAALDLLYSLRGKL